MKGEPVPLRLDETSLSRAAGTEFVAAGPRDDFVLGASGGSHEGQSGAAVADDIPSLSLALAGGVVSFMDNRSRSELLPTSPQVALALRVEGRTAGGFGVLADVSGSWGQSRLELLPSSPVPFRHCRLSLGLGAPYLWRKGWLGLYAGPRVEALYLRRSFHVEAFSGAQEYLTVSPGVVSGVVLSLGARLEMTTQVGSMLTYLVVDGQGRAVGSISAWAGVGYRF